MKKIRVWTSYYEGHVDSILASLFFVMIIIGGGVVLSKNSFLNTDFASGIYGLVFMVFVVFFIRFEWKHLDLTKTKIFCSAHLWDHFTK